MITDIDEYFSKGCGRCERFGTPDCSTRRWQAGLQALRRLCLAAGLEETVKWGHPCYVHGERNIAILGAFRENFRLSFFDAALLKDADGILQKQGPNSQHPSAIFFTDNKQVDELDTVIQATLREAIGYAEAGIRAPKNTVEPDMPDELTDALASDPELAEAFEALTPGRRRSYAIAIGSAKKAETRITRIERYRDKIFSGKGALER